MLTRDEVLEIVKSGRNSQCIDGRDYSRLSSFFSADDWGTFGFTLKDGAVAIAPHEWTRENILTQLTSDLAFAFEKALNKRGISAGCMYEVIKMWMWVLQDELYDFEDYAEYGLPLFKAVALKYGLENPIGDDAGDEYRYASD